MPGTGTNLLTPYANYWLMVAFNFLVRFRRRHAVPVHPMQPSNDQIAMVEGSGTGLPSKVFVSEFSWNCSGALSSCKRQLKTVAPVGNRWAVKKCSA
jgi:hypothetical protein